MAIIYVNSAAGGANDGTSWTDAYTSFGSAWTNWASGDVVYMHYAHSESSGSELLYSGNAASNTDPFVCYCVDKDNSDAYTPQTSSYNLYTSGTDTDIDFDDACVFYGVYFQIADGDLDVSGAAPAWFYDCTFHWTNTLSNQRFVNLPTGDSVNFDSCTFKCDDASWWTYFFGSYARGRWTGCTFIGKWSTNGVFESSGSVGSPVPSLYIVGCDFSGVTSSTEVCNGSGCVRVVNCELGSTLTGAIGVFNPTSVNMRVEAFASTQAGASTGKSYEVEVHTRIGEVDSDTSIYRTAGWTDADGGTQLSHKMTPASFLQGPHTPFFGPDLVAYADTTGSKTFTVYCVHDFATAPTQDEAWIEVLYLGTSNATLSFIESGRSRLSSATWTVGTEAWTGAAGKTKMELSATATINKVGWYTVRVYLGKYEVSKALWYCPQVEVS